MFTEPAAPHSVQTRHQPTCDHGRSEGNLSSLKSTMRLQSPLRHWTLQMTWPLASHSDGLPGYISTRLAAAKGRGVTLGNPRLDQARRSAIKAVRTEADKYAANVLPIIREAQKAGATSLREIAEALNARGIATARGGQWYASSVRNVLERA